MSTTYLSRPVFDFTVDWEKTPLVKRTYDLRQLDLAFGVLRFAPLQSNVAHGFEFVLKLWSEQAILDFESFVASAMGRLTGFWFPSPLTAVQVANGIDATSFDIIEQNLRNTWTDNPDIYLAFFKSGQATQFAKITGVVADGPLEKITIDAALTIDQTWTCCRLLYVRFSSDDEAAEFFREQAQNRTIQVLELPTEYAAIETGQRPVYFYRFFFGGPGAALSSANDWFYTSFQADVASTYNGAMASQTHSRQPINHGALVDSLEADAPQTTITAYLDAGTPFVYLLPFAPPRALWVEIRSAAYATPNTTTLLLTGQVLTAAAVGRKLTINVGSLLDTLGKRFLGMVVQTGCNYHLYDPATCKVDKTAWGVACTVKTIVGRRVTITGAGLAGSALNWFARGWLSLGTGRTIQNPTILQSDAASGNDVALFLNASLTGIAINDAATAYPGCDNSRGATGCAKFGNDVNFGGHMTCRRNLTLPTLPVSNTSPNKK